MIRSPFVALTATLAAAFAAPFLPAQVESRGTWLAMFRGGSLSVGARPLQLIGGLVPRIGRRATIDVRAPGSGTGLLLLGSRATTGIAVPFSAGSLPLYTMPLVTTPLSYKNGFAQLSVNIPNDTNLIGMDFAFQATGSGIYGLAVSNLLLGNIGARDNGPWGKLSFQFTGRAPKHERNNVRVIAGDLKDRFHGSMPVLTNFGAGRYVQLVVSLDRDLRPGHKIEIRTGTQQTGTVIDSVTKRSQSILLRVPSGSALVPLNLYFHNTDPNADIGLRWEFIGG